MPNFIHSLDAANVHLLLDKLSIINLPAYTVHDCFASTPNNMLKLEDLVKKAFINIYFNNRGYLIDIHEHFVTNIISATDPIYELSEELRNLIIQGKIINLDKIENLDELNLLDGEYKLVINRYNKEIYNIPNLPSWFHDRTEKKILNDFIKGLLTSKYFIA